VSCCRPRMAPYRAQGGVPLVDRRPVSEQAVGIVGVEPKFRKSFPAASLQSPPG
jgi:hypothetical protein